MNKWCFLLIAACLLAPDTGHAALKARDDVKAEDAFNPNPAPDDLILPMPCGQSMRNTMPIRNWPSYYRIFSGGPSTFSVFKNRMSSA